MRFNTPLEFLVIFYATKYIRALYEYKNYCHHPPSQHDFPGLMRSFFPHPFVDDVDTRERNMKKNFCLIFFFATKEYFCHCILGYRVDSHKCPITNHTLSKPCKTFFCVIIIEKENFPSKQPVECKSSGKDATTHMAWHMLKRHNNNSKTFSLFSVSLSLAPTERETNLHADADDSTSWWYFKQML